MHRERRVLRLGTLWISGGAFTFEPVESTAKAAVGDDVEVGVSVDWREGSLLKETAEVVLTVERGSTKLGRTALEVRDRPVLDDREIVFLFVPIHAKAPGRIEGRYSLVASQEESSWGSHHRGDPRTFSQEGAFTIEIG
ncbi:MAG TPA: hypothetical protein VM889_13790 [Candidatus Thermoplasmatota archaeon]|nr:hypothetical protein [Candidatus Thermoplasmatota archaeon]